MALLKKSTRAFITEARQTPNFSLFDILHGYFYMVFPYTYIGNGMGERKPARLYLWIRKQWHKFFPVLGTTKPKASDKVQFADTYHGKVVPLETACELVNINQEITYSYPEQVIPYKLARDIILKDPTHIVVLDCPCRVERANPCLPLDVCLIIGEPFASMVIEHHPNRSRWITTDEAQEILKAEEERGHVHHAFFKQAVLDRFYAICNCCACCCGAMQAQRMGTPMLASSGYLSQVDESACLGCETCVSVCQFHAISMQDGVARVDEETCMGCGVCVSHCENEALSLQLAPHKGIPMEIPA